MVVNCWGSWGLMRNVYAGGKQGQAERRYSGGVGHRDPTITFVLSHLIEFENSRPSTPFIGGSISRRVFVFSCPSTMKFYCGQSSSPSRDDSGMISHDYARLCLGEWWSAWFRLECTYSFVSPPTAALRTSGQADVIIECRPPWPCAHSSLSCRLLARPPGL